MNNIIKRITGVMLVVVMIAAVSCSGKKKYSDIREFIDEVVVTQNEFLTLLENSSKADDAVAAIDEFGNKLIKLSEKSVEIKKRYPDIDKWVDNPPAELKTDLEKLENTGRKFEKVFVKENVRSIVKEKKVQKAFIELNKKMESVKFFQ
jgi:hypothetical protein